MLQDIFLFLGPAVTQCRSEKRNVTCSKGGARPLITPTPSSRIGGTPVER